MMYMNILTKRCISNRLNLSFVTFKKINSCTCKIKYILLHGGDGLLSGFFTFIYPRLRQEKVSQQKFKLKSN